MLNPIYRMIDGYPPATFDDYWHAGIILMLVIGIMWTAVAMLVKSLKEIPAIFLNDKFLVINTKNISIKWSDIRNVRIGGSKSTYLIVELKDPSAYFPDSIIRKIGRFFSLSLNANEFAIGLALVLGDNDEILKTINEFHQKYK